VGGVSARDLGVMQVELEGDQVTARLQRAREPDRAVRAERPDLEDASRAARTREEVQQLPLRRRHRDRRKMLGDVRLQRGAQYVVRRLEMLREVVVDLRPDLRGHACEVVSGGQCGSLPRSRPYVQVPSIALAIATTITPTPLPSSANSGPGHAPVSAQPSP